MRCLCRRQLTGSCLLQLHGLGSALPSTSRLADPGRKASYMNKLESIASSAVRAADKVSASLIIVFTQTGVPPSCMLMASPLLQSSSRQRRENAG